MKMLRYSLVLAAAALTSTVFMRPVQADETPVASTQPVAPEVAPFAATVVPSQATSPIEKTPTRPITTGQNNETLIQAPDGIRWQLVDPTTGIAGKPFLLPAYQPGLSKFTRVGERFAYIGHIRRADRMQLACISFNLNKGLVTFRQDSTLFAPSDGDSGDAPSFTGDGYAASCQLKGEKCNTLGTCEVAEERISIGRNSAVGSARSNDGATTQKTVCSVKGKGRKKVKTCRVVNVKSPTAQSNANAEANDEGTQKKRVCTTTGKGRKKTTKCRIVTVAAHAAQDAASASTSSAQVKKVCSTTGKGRNKVTKCKAVKVSADSKAKKSQAKASSKTKASAKKSTKAKVATSKTSQTKKKAN